MSDRVGEAARIDDDVATEACEVAPLGPAVELIEPFREQSRGGIGRLEDDALMQAGGDLDEPLEKAALACVALYAPVRFPRFVRLPIRAGVEELGA